MPATLGPRLVIAGTHSGVGKTTVATGLMAALRDRGIRVGAAKVGPDYIDPGYHALATGRPGRNLDAWLCGAQAMAPLAAQAGAGTDVLIVEGVMGLFDGAADDGAGSTAHVATLLRAPVVLVIDASAMSGSVAALLHGFVTFDRAVRVAGVILNRVGSDGHETMLRDALRPLGVPVLGALRRSDNFAWRDRHLGLVPVVEQPAAIGEALRRLAEAVAHSCDLDALLALAGSAPSIAAGPGPAARPAATDVRVAVAAGPAFSFTYPDNLELLSQAGAELVPFDPLSDAALPAAVDGLYVGGGFPEIFASQLAANRPLLADVTGRIADGLVTWAECGGLLWLCRALDHRAMAGVIPADATMTDRLTLGYRTATVEVANPLAEQGATMRGHEFHYSALEPPGRALSLVGRFATGRAGYASPTLLASYLHLHLAADPTLAEHFLATITMSACRSR